MKLHRIISAVTALTIFAGASAVYSGSIVNYTLTASAETDADGNEYIEGSYGDLIYKDYDDHIEISVCDESAESIDIPVRIDGIPVTSIGNFAFSSCDKLKSVTIPAGVTSIGHYAFEGCRSLTSVTIPDSVTSIGASAFSGTPWLENKQKDSPLVIINDLLIDGTTCNGATVIPDGVISIEDWAFEDCFGLTSITIPDSVAVIKDGAFAYCENLISVTLPDHITSIGSFAFYRCFSLKAITIPDSVTSIGDYAFDTCVRLTEITLPESITSIGDGIFQACKGLTSINIPESITSISDLAFCDCSGLTEITIPENITCIGCDAFIGCSSLQSITILDPDCDIYDSSSTITNGYNGSDYFNGTIYGYKNSTAQAYANKYKRNFVDIGEAPGNDILYGDANCDKEVSMADAVLIMQAQANPDRYGVGGSDENCLTEQGRINGDCYDPGSGITANDALSIQKYMLEIITGLPEKITYR